jgi:hypothetical protein
VQMLMISFESWCCDDSSRQKHRAPFLRKGRLKI